VNDRRELGSERLARIFKDSWPAIAAALGVGFILLDFLATGNAHLNGLSGIGMAFCGVFPVVHYDRARKGGE
jgi:hypothetical protein